MIKIELSPAVIHKLLSIKEYIAIELDSPSIAQNTVDNILGAFERLKCFPDSAPLLSAFYDKIPDRYAKTRFLVCDKYVAIYEQIGDTIHILQVYHGKEDYIRHLLRSL